MQDSRKTFWSLLPVSLRTQCYLFSEVFNPWIVGAHTIVESIARDRHSPQADHPWMARKREVIERTTDLIGPWRKIRDAEYEQAFALLYGAGTAPEQTTVQDLPRARAS